ncbi:hypothetical protein ACIBJD_22235 [Kitasatospora sp. NPDC050467]|uniref:hypothetical protein n=1 Tax=Kitasatospora sp. NPDC050467 TaxID=3364053 RepID=UPI0037A9247F
MSQGILPAAGGGEGAGAVGDDDPPQPRPHFRALLVGLGELGRDGDAVEEGGGGGGGGDGAVEVEEQLMAALMVAGADVEAGEVDDRLESADGAHRG